MSSALKHSLWYVITIIVLLVAVAMYFFYMMGKSLTSERESTDTLLIENKSLVEQSQSLRLTISQLEAQLSEHTNRQRQQQALISDSQASQQPPDPQVQCPSLPSPEALSALEKQLADAQSNATACTAELTEVKEQLEPLQIAALRTDDIEIALQTSQGTVETLQAELDSARQVNQQLRTELSERPDTDQTGQLEAQLTRANQQISVLQNRLDQLAIENQELIATAQSSDQLEMIEFVATPNYCPAQFAQNAICLASIEILATFNFSPSGFIAMKVVNPDGDTIKRESIAARKINRVLIDIGDEQPSLPGEYQVEFTVDDVFNPFNQIQRFPVNQGVR